MSFLLDQLLLHVNSVRPVHHVSLSNFSILAMSQVHLSSRDSSFTWTTKGSRCSQFPPRVSASITTSHQSCCCLSRDHSSLTFFVGSTMKMQLLPCFDFIQSSLCGTMPEPSSAFQCARSHFHYRTSFSCLSFKGSSPNPLFCDFHQEFHFLSNPLNPVSHPSRGLRIKR